MTIKLSSRSYVRDVLKRHGFHIRKKYGQNFLVDEHILGKIVAAAQLPEQAQVLEIGPGLGTLTRELAAATSRVVAVEIDTMLQPLLAETLADLTNVELVFADALKADLDALLSAELTRYAVANLPYYITTPLLLKLLDLQPKAERIVVLVQREVAERMLAQPGGKEYGSLTVLSQGLAKVELVGIVPKSVFYPAPDVESAIVALQPYSKEQHGILSRPSFELTNRAVFGQRRKTLANALKGSPHWQLSAEQIEAALRQCDLDGGLRGEQLSVGQIIALANRLNEDLAL